MALRFKSSDPLRYSIIFYLGAGVPFWFGAAACNTSCALDSVSSVRMGSLFRGQTQYTTDALRLRLSNICAACKSRLKPYKLQSSEAAK